MREKEVEDSLAVYLPYCTCLNAKVSYNGCENDEILSHLHSFPSCLFLFVCEADWEAAETELPRDPDATPAP